MARNPIFTVICEELTEPLAGHRHVLCPHYDACLDEAINKNLSFDCRQCIFKKKDITIHLPNNGFSTPFDHEHQSLKVSGISFK